MKEGTVRPNGIIFSEAMTRSEAAINMLNLQSINGPAASTWHVSSRCIFMSPCPSFPPAVASQLLLHSYLHPNGLSPAFDHSLNQYWAYFSVNHSHFALRSHASSFIFCHRYHHFVEWFYGATLMPVPISLGVWLIGILISRFPIRW